MKGGQLVRKLRALGVEIDGERGKGGHVLATYRGRQTTIPMHGATDMGPVLVRRICKQLGIDPARVLGR